LAIWYWLRSRTARQAMELRRHIRRLLRAQSDRLPPEGNAEVAATLAALEAAWTSGASPADVRAQMRATQELADRWLVDSSKSRVRESFEMVWVALIIVLALRSFVAQPMTIPTGSMQPTLFGITLTDLREGGDTAIPGLSARLADRWLRGRTYHRVVARSGGYLRRVPPPEPVVPFLGVFPSLQKQRFQIGESWYTVWLTPGELPNPLGVKPEHAFLFYAGVRPDRLYRSNDLVLQVAVDAGDHILVDRLSYNFRRPRRGEIVVFQTHDVPEMPGGTYYIKRLVGLAGERVRIGNDRHVSVNSQRLDATTPHFENVYTFSGPPRDSHYSGHLNELAARRYGLRLGSLVKQFPNGSAEFTVRPGHYLVLGDNTVGSVDSRQWGDLPQENVGGRFGLVYWPLGRRFGWGQR